MSGDQGADIYRFSAGFGHDSISPGETGLDWIEFDSSITRPISSCSAPMTDGRVADLTDDLLVRVKGTEDVIEIRYALSEEPYQDIAGIRFADGTIWTMADIVAAAVPTPGVNLEGAVANDTLTGTASADFLDSGGGTDILIGGAGDDELYGGDGDDILDGGAGGDYLQGDAGSDIYRFSAGFGNDEIWEEREEGSVNAIVFDASVAAADIAVYFSHDSWSLILKSVGTNDSIFIDGAYEDEDLGVDEVRFDDGTVWTRDQLLANAVELPGDLIEGDETDQTLTGSAFDDSIDGGDGNEIIFGAAGNDEIFAGDGDDILIGGSGDDLMFGNAGNDTYRFSAGFGSDRVLVSDFSGEDSDVIEFDATIAAADVRLTLQGEDIDWGVLLSIDGSTDQITLRWLDQSDEIHFDDGTVWTYDDILSRLQPWQGVDLIGDQGTDILGTSGWDRLSANDDVASLIVGYAGDDFMTGSRANDILDGGTGNDVLRGDEGADTYRFSAGFGQDTIYDTQSGTEESGPDVNHIVFDATISSDDIIVEHDSVYGGDLTWADVILRVAGTEDRITLSSGFGDADYDIHFADGTVWNADDIRARWSLIDQPYQEGDQGGGPLIGGATNDTIYGSNNDDIIEGRGGNDTLYGFDGNDILVGGTGSDQLYGYGGSDTYRFSAGFGEDRIYDSANSDEVNVIEFDATIDPAQVSVLSDSSDLWGTYYLSIAGSEDRVWVSRNGHDAVISEVRFADGTVWTAADIEARLTYSDRPTITNSATGAQLLGTAGSDTLTGTDGPDEINGEGSVQWRSVGANLLVNGSFEQLAADASPMNWGYSATTMPGWTRVDSTQPATTLGLEQINSGYDSVTATDGNYWFDLDGIGDGGGNSNVHIVQDVTGLAEGETLLIQFDHANRSWDTDGSFDVLWNGDVVASFTNTGRTMVRSSVLVTTAAGTNQLGFRGTGWQDGVGASLDNVKLTARGNVREFGRRQRRAFRHGRRRSHSRRSRRRHDLRRQRQGHALRQWRQRRHHRRCRQ